MHEGVVARKIAAEGGKSELIEKNNEIRRRNSLLQSLAAQFKAIGEKIKQLEDELTREREDIALELNIHLLKMMIVTTLHSSIV